MDPFQSLGCAEWQLWMRHLAAKPRYSRSSREGFGVGATSNRQWSTVGHDPVCVWQVPQISTSFFCPGFFCGIQYRLTRSHCHLVKEFFSFSSPCTLSREEYMELNLTTLDSKQQGAYLLTPPSQSLAPDSEKYGRLFAFPQRPFQETEESQNVLT